jgi:NAD(P)-dependent dehydrogenase (short-subunit alcohol dehydrogenase family)
MNMQSSSNKIALVTGANKGIGFEVAPQIGYTGATVLTGARNKAAGEEATTALRAEGVAARFIQIDVVDYASIDAAAATVTSGFGRLDILVNNAGITVIAVPPVRRLNRRGVVNAKVIRM